MRHHFHVVSAFLDEMMTKINSAWYNKEDQVSPRNLGMTKDQLTKNQERNENMAKVMTKIDLLTKHFMGGS